LEFLAHGLRFLDPPPRTVRELSQSILDHAFSGDPDDKERCNPLHHLVVGCTNAREIVRSEIYEQVLTLISSADPQDHLNGLRLAVWVDDRNIQAQDNRVGSWDLGLWEFWTEAASSAVTSYSDKIIAAARHSTMMKYMALVRGLITVEQALIDTQPDLEVLFNTQPTFFGIDGPPYLLRQVYDLTHGRNWYRNKDPIPDLQAFGRFVMEHSESPFVTNPDGYANWLAHLHEGKASKVLPDEASYLGASLAFAIGAEASDEIPVHWEPGNQFGVLSDLYPYIIRRYRIDPDAELSPLPLPRWFRELFKSWANRETDFTSIQG
jgi:hypothetical protein